MTPTNDSMSTSAEGWKTMVSAPASIHRFAASAISSGVPNAARSFVRSYFQYVISSRIWRAASGPVAHST
jgi:hypothetical protein